MLRATITAEARATASGQRARFRHRRGVLRLAGLRLVATTVLFHFASPGVALTGIAHLPCPPGRGRTLRRVRRPRLTHR